MKPVVLCILDGWGIAPAGPYNAIAQARTPVWDRLLGECPNARLDASAQAVGLPDGQMGNSEVGHMTIGAGRVLMQDLPLINRAIADGALSASKPLARFVEQLRLSGGACHLAGLLSPGGVHSHQDHMVALAKAVAGGGVPVAVHSFLDGRDTPPRSGLDYLAKFESRIRPLKHVFPATITGRYYGMDRDRNWDRTQRAYSVLVDGHGARAVSAATAIGESYRIGKGDEFVAPTAVGGYTGMADGDGLLVANFRADRVRQILTALLDPDFDAFPRRRKMAFAGVLGMRSYSETLDGWLPALFPPTPPRDALGALVSAAGLRQLRTAETEKYAHVTFFLNGGREAPFPGETRVLVPSPKVTTYDLAPAMAAATVTDGVVSALNRRDAHLVVVNFANADMVGHTGDLSAAMTAVEAVDRCLGRIVDAARRVSARLLITADHGNVEQMHDPASGERHTAHTTNPVPVILAGAETGTRLNNGSLADIAPTVLDLLGLPRPTGMTGQSLKTVAGAGVPSHALA